MSTGYTPQRIDPVQNAPWWLSQAEPQEGGYTGSQIFNQMKHCSASYAEQLLRRRRQPAAGLEVWIGGRSRPVRHHARPVAPEPGWGSASGHRERRGPVRLQQPDADSIPPSIPGRDPDDAHRLHGRSVTCQGLSSAGRAMTSEGPASEPALGRALVAASAAGARSCRRASTTTPPMNTSCRLKKRSSSRRRSRRSATTSLGG
jgi:hypothetical protein